MLRTVIFTDEWFYYKMNGYYLLFNSIYSETFSRVFAFFCQKKTLHMYYMQCFNKKIF